MTDEKKPLTLDEAFAHQMNMQVHVYGDGTELKDYDENRRSWFLAIQILATLDELHEALAEVGWKPWASSRHLNREAFKGELVDALHFFMNIMGAADISPQELLEGYFAKAAKNKKRQEDGYDGVTTKCPGCKRALDDDAVKCYEVITSEQADALGIGISTIDPRKRVFYCSQRDAIVFGE